jgi:hypothetical protein
MSVDIPFFFWGESLIESLHLEYSEGKERIFLE